MEETTMDLPRARSTWLPCILAALVGASLLLPAAAVAAPIVAAATGAYKLVPKDGLVLISTPNTATGKASVRFNYHPVKEDSFDKLKKDFKDLGVAPNNATFKYQKTDNEQHGTTGSVTHIFAIKEIEVKVGDKTIKTPQVTDAITSTIEPGKNEKGKVSNDAAFKDPVVFSDDPADLPQFPFASAGIDVAFSLLGGTAFPAIFAADPSQFGAVAAETVMTFRARVVPGAEADPDAFWSDSLAGFDLFTLTIRSDADHTVHAVLTPGADTSSFALDFTGFAAAQATLEGGFSTLGALTAALDDVFAVGFVPRGTVSAFTVGYQQALVLTVNEVVPLPSTLSLAVAALALQWLRRRSRAAAR
jgi:hypothetical protein